MVKAVGLGLAQLGNLELFGFEGVLDPLGGHSCPHCDSKLLPVFILQGAPGGLFYLCLRETIMTGLFQAWVAIFRGRFRVFPPLAQLPLVRGSLPGAVCCLQQFSRSDS